LNLRIQALIVFEPAQTGKNVALRYFPWRENDKGEAWGFSARCCVCAPAAGRLRRARFDAFGR
jgi:hypothetical protein